MTSFAPPRAGGTCVRHVRRAAAPRTAHVEDVLHEQRQLPEGGHSVEAAWGGESLPAQAAATAQGATRSGLGVGHTGGAPCEPRLSIPLDPGMLRAAVRHERSLAGARRRGERARTDAILERHEREVDCLQSSRQSRTLSGGGAAGSGSALQLWLTTLLRSRRKAHWARVARCPQLIWGHGAGAIARGEGLVARQWLRRSGRRVIPRPLLSSPRDAPWSGPWSRRPAPSLRGR